MIFNRREDERAVAARQKQQAAPGAVADVAPDDLQRPDELQRRSELQRDEVLQQRDDLQLRGDLQRRDGPQRDDLPRGDDPQRPPEHRAAPDGREQEEPLSSLFTPEAARDFRASWDAVQISFVDDPAQAVRKADELVRQVLDDLGRTFSAERAAFDGQGADEAERTERLRMALRRYRAFLQRLLSL